MASYEEDSKNLAGSTAEGLGTVGNLIRMGSVDVITNKLTESWPYR